ncbi:MAG: rRNA adenine dimethyltransferase family protein, partial [Armatimonadota bacterium]
AEAAPTAKLVHEDALRLDWPSTLADLAAPRAIVSNMPYNITGPLLERVCASRGMIAVAVLMMQKEVGEKILCQAGDSGRGALSVVMQRQFDVSRVCAAPSGAFSPPPKVDSVVLKFVPREGLREDEDQIAKLVRRGFVQPRKKLSNNLGELGWAVQEAGLDPNIRPHQLTESEWVRLHDARLRHHQG